jgi:hypothetical protein
VAEYGPGVMELTPAEAHRRSSSKGGLAKDVDLNAAPIARCAFLRRKDAIMDAFDFAAEAELYPAQAKGSRRQPVGYRRFDCAANAIRYAVEELAEQALIGAYLETGEKRFNGKEIRQLYGRPDYPLERRPKMAADGDPARTGGVVISVSAAPVRKKPPRRLQP